MEATQQSMRSAQLSPAEARQAQGKAFADEVQVTTSMPFLVHKAHVPKRSQIRNEVSVESIVKRRTVEGARS
jgi:hypothetical protein